MSYLCRCGKSFVVGCSRFLENPQGFSTGRPQLFNRGNRACPKVFPPFSTGGGKLKFSLSYKGFYFFPQFTFQTFHTVFHKLWKTPVHNPWEMSPLGTFPRQDTTFRRQNLRHFQSSHLSSRQMVGIFPTFWSVFSLFWSKIRWILVGSRFSTRLFHRMWETFVEKSVGKHQNVFDG